MQKLKDNLETIVAFCVIVGMVVAAMMFLATKAEVQAVQQQVTMNELKGDLREVNSAIIQTDKQLMWMEQKLADSNQNCQLNPRWRELRQQLDGYKLQQKSLQEQIQELKGKK
jgi:uncharacterized coiled-coil DUF342 family protein